MAVGLPVVLAAIGAGASVAGFVGQVQAARSADEARSAQLREQQVQLRLQQNQRSLARGKLLRQTLATAAVQSSVRGISPNSSTLRAITEDSLQSFMEDENMDKLNFGAKQVQTDWGLANSRTQRNAEIFAATTQLGMNVAKVGFSYAQVPNSSLMTASQSSASNFNPNK